MLKMLDTSTQNLVAQATRSPEFVHPWPTINKTTSGICPIVGFEISDVVPLGCITTELSYNKIVVTFLMESFSTHLTFMWFMF
jgi:hypothetical protein